MKPNQLPRSFNLFWRVYPRKVGKGTAAKAWVKNGCDDVIDDILKDLRGRTWPQDKQYIPHPTTYLNGWRWMDEEPGDAEDENW